MNIRDTECKDVVLCNDEKKSIKLKKFYYIECIPAL